MSLRTAAYAGLLLVVPFSSAFAQDATTVGERVKSALSRQGTTLSFDRISGDASTMLIEGARISIAPESAEIALGNITLTDVRENAGYVVVGSIILPNYSVTRDGMTVNATGIGFTNLRLPAPDSTDAMAGFWLCDAAQMQNVTVTIGDKQAFAMDRLHFEMDMPANGKSLTFSAAADKFSGDLSVVGDPNARKLIDALGLRTVTGTLDLSGFWRPADGRLAIEEYDISIDRAGTLGLTFELGGYTPDFIKSVQALQKEMAAASEAGENSAQAKSALGLMQQLTFRSASIRLEDASLTGKMIDYLAGAQKVTQSDVVNQAKGLLPFLVARLDDAKLTAQTTAAVSTYLDDPRSIEVTAQPANPVPFSQIMAAAVSQSLKDLVKILGVSVKANQPGSDSSAAE
ncbi:MAG TPA: hypothetical protein VNS34_08525 [Rhizobiaceae bacterium]|nr:hypothetical protein [Rhizobiaceae bacterium]